MNQVYTVKRGDTLYGISNQFGVSVTDLKKINNLSSNTLQVGQTLKIPNLSGTNPSDTFNYTVKKGDSLYKIANLYNTTVDEIVRLNNLNSINISIGQIILIPEIYNNQISLPNYINYTVKRGDTLYKIAQEYGITAEIIKQDNGLMSNTLTVGQNLKIRVSDDNIEECFGIDDEDTNNITTYIVKSGDSLYKIANSFNTSVSELKRINSLNTNNLSIGQVLKIPNSNVNNNVENVYTVKSGDNLYSIARRFNTSVDSIKKKNNLLTNNLSIGQKLYI